MCWPGFKWNQFPKEELTVLQSGVAFSDRRWAGMGIMLGWTQVLLPNIFGLGNWF